MKKVLFISYAFPPIGGGGIFRITKFIKYLPQFGIEPRVLTVDDHNHARMDQSLLQEIPAGVNITRVDYFEPAKLINTRLWQSFLNYIWYPWFSISDPRIAWYKAGLKKALEIIEQEKIDIVFTSFACATDHLIALELKKRTGIRWVADFRDEWASSNYYRFPTPLHRARIKNLEKKVVLAADIITTVSEPITNYFRGISGNKEKCITITNGFDAEDFKGSVLRPSRNYCQILYSGALYGSRTIDVFREALEELALPDLKLEILGGKDHLTHSQAIEKQRQADILLLVLSPKDQPGVFTGKIFEYLASRRPILALSPKNTEAAKLISDLNAGTVVEPEDKEEIKRVLKEFYQKYQNNNLDIAQLDLARFDRKNLTRDLAQIFTELKKPKTKVCLIANTKSPQNERLAKYLYQKSYGLTFVSLDETQIEGISNYELKQKRIKTKFKPIIYLNGLINKARSLTKFKKLLKEIKPDIVHGHGVNFGGILASFSGFHPLVITVRGSDIMKISEQIKPEQLLIKKALTKADLVTGSSIALKNKAIELGLAEDNFRLVFYGVDSEIFKKREVLELRKKLKLNSEKIIFCPRAIKPVYNIDLLLKAVSKLKDQNYKLILLGYNVEKEYLNKINQLAKDLQLENKLVFLPSMDERQMSDFYNLADVVVSVAKSDGLSVSFLEAMACEAKIVLSEVGFAKEWYRSNNFWQVPIGDIELTAQAIEQALALNKSEFASTGKANRDLVLSRAEINKGFEALEEVYRELLDR